MDAKIALQRIAFSTADVEPECYSPSINCNCACLFVCILFSEIYIKLLHSVTQGYIQILIKADTYNKTGDLDILPVCLNEVISIII